MPGALDVMLPTLSADELGWLATLPDVESRLVFTESSAGRTIYRVQDGPFTDAELASLPPRDWTLLVQDVEKHLPDFRSFFAAADFIPDWRIDDLMVSCAAPGGSVGPHRDNYDVFLCQGAGNRTWTIGNIETAVVDTDASELSLLKPFEATSTFSAAANDVLYLPPGVPHWGIAENLCITYSIGMRAPSKAELACAAERIYSEGTSESNSSDDIFYTDADLQPEEVEPGRISKSAIRRLRTQNLLSRTLSDEQLATVLGSVSTDTKAWLTPDMPDKKQLAKIMGRFGGQPGLLVHGMARIAFCELANSGLFFANGFFTELGLQELGLARELCTTRKVCASEFNGQDAAALIEWLATKGVFDPGIG